MTTKKQRFQSGDEITMSELVSRRTDMKFMVNAGGHLYITEGGDRRVAIVPPHVAEAYYQDGQSDSDDTTDSDDHELPSEHSDAESVIGQ